MSDVLHLSIDHLSPRTRLLLLVSGGSLKGAPAIEMDGGAVHLVPRRDWTPEQEYLLGSAPDLCLVEAYAQGRVAASVLIDRHGPRRPELPTYTVEGEVTAPEADLWKEAFHEDDGMMLLSIKNAEEISHGYPPFRPAH